MPVWLTWIVSLSTAMPSISPFQFLRKCDQNDQVRHATWTSDLKFNEQASLHYTNHDLEWHAKKFFTEN
jgi:hypothetical protein